MYTESKQKNESAWMQEEVGTWGMSLYFLISIALTILHAWTITVLWTWFIMPLGVMSISIPQAAGLALFIGMFKSNQVKTKSHEYYITSIIHTLVVCVVGLLLGWIYFQLMG